MDDSTSLPSELGCLVGQQVVVDTKGPYVYIGVLEKVGRNSVLLKNCDVHDTRESNTPNELYLIQTLKNGVRSSREAVYVLLKEVVSISRLEDVVLY